MLASGVCAQLKTLTIRNNAVGDKGLARLAAAITAENLPQLAHVDATGNPGAEEAEGEAASKRLEASGASEHAMAIFKSSLNFE